MKTMKNRASPVLASTVLALAACGGGEHDDTTTVDSQATTSSARTEVAAAASRTVDRAAPRLQATTESTTWVKVADEWQTFFLSAPTRVRYGAGSTWIERDLPTGVASCTNGFFGEDPLVGIVKSCEAAQSAGAWVKLADEWQAFTLTQPTRVRYGFGSTWIELDLPAGQAFCTNTFFGNDPLVGIVKQCEGWDSGATPPPPPGSWSFLANEWQPFRLDRPRRVRYGSGSTWIERDLPAGQGLCTNDFFGMDPLVGIVKRCEVLEEGGEPPPPPPPSRSCDIEVPPIPDGIVNLGTPGFETINGSPWMDYLSGGGTPSGGTDTIDAGDGGDVICFDRGDGWVQLVMGTAVPQGVNTIQLGDGILPTQVTLEPGVINVIGRGLLFGRERDRIDFPYFGPGGNNPVQFIRFRDGTVWDYSAMLGR